MAAFSSILAATAIAGATVAITKAASGSGKDKGGVGAPLPLPQAPKVEDAADKALETAKRRKTAATQTIYSSPLGLKGEADVAKKTLLGQ